MGINTCINNACVYTFFQANEKVNTISKPNIK